MHIENEIVRHILPCAFIEGRFQCFTVERQKLLTFIGIHTGRKEPRLFRCNMFLDITLKFLVALLTHMREVEEHPLFDRILEVIFGNRGHGGEELIKESSTLLIDAECIRGPKSNSLPCHSRMEFQNDVRTDDAFKSPSGFQKFPFWIEKLLWIRPAWKLSEEFRIACS